MKLHCISKTFRILFFFAIILSVAGCVKKSNSGPNTVPPSIDVSSDGTRITFSEGNPGLQQIKSTEINKGTVMISVFAPARVVAIISVGTASKERFVLFESSDIASLYSSYKQAKSNVDLTSKNLDRTKDMFKNLAATGRDLNQAETDAANAKSSLAEMESRLRGAGFNPQELDQTPPGTIWLMADVLESQLSDVDKGESVDIYFNAFPDKKYEGRAVAVGDVIDPTTRTVKVRVTMRDPQGKFIPGMFGKVDFGDPKDNVLLIPLSAVCTVEGTDYVFLQKGNHQFERQPVVLGQQNEKNVIILKGINSGDKIVTDGTLLMKGLSFKF
jgi:membrane fusion protein, heavy metal efflux system